MVDADLNVRLIDYNKAQFKDLVNVKYRTLPFYTPGLKTVQNIISFDQAMFIDEFAACSCLYELFNNMHVTGQSLDTSSFSQAQYKRMVYSRKEQIVSTCYGLQRLVASLSRGLVI